MMGIASVASLAAQPLIAGDHHHVHIEPDKFACQLREAIGISFRRFGDDGDVLALDISQVTKTLAECLVVRRRQGRIQEHADAGRFVHLLRAGERQKSLCQYERDAK
jgi:hypothetical protein